jgi:hypothetical protein
VARVYDLREELTLFLEEENQEIAETFLLKLAYLSDILEKFNLLNTSMQGYDTNILVGSDKLNAFVRKIGLWISKIEERNLDISQIECFYRGQYGNKRDWNTTVYQRALD